jgi:hypothetical protein
MECAVMRAPQAAGFAVTIAVVMAIDLPVGWLIFVAMLSGGLATFAIEYWLRIRR